MEKNSNYRLNVKKFKAINWIVIGVLVVLAGAMVIRPVPMLPEKDLVVITGKVVEIYEGGVKDVNLRLEGRSELFYVNRGLERGLNLQELKAQLIKEYITIKYPDHWSLVNFNESNLHISKIEHRGKTVFTEVSN